ncbi:MAG: hypothetical protein CVU78_01245 [Elusimicrobia bacterium HGW-Elusimicrobia-2]|nr:MAG: hypothetical protein CVU78_01245 [Elusimicrobia bacterium HGW-Elusimicrobia-2]
MDKFKVDGQKMFYFPGRIAQWFKAGDNWEKLKKIYPIYHKNPFIFFGFPGKMSFIHVDDLATALVRCISSDTATGKIYFAETEATAIGDIFKIIYRNIYQRQLKQIAVPRFSHLE